jgi:2-polyprenyl-3-methyl-5-hydroxy-6-metoxy-1,4-benzoquinol methylase
MKDYKYIGSELSLFKNAKNWKKYYSKIIIPYLGQFVLEVGAGIGATTKVLCRSDHKRWVCLEPDPSLNEILQVEVNSLPICEVKKGSLIDIGANELFDSIIYVDVLEHIQDDTEEIKMAVKHLKTEGFLIVLAPAHQWLFSSFDESVGHYRRYNYLTVKQLTLADLKLINLKYLDSVGLIASLSNRYLRQAMPTLRQIRVWDTWMIPISKIIDPLLRYKFGKSIIAVWQKS